MRRILEVFALLAILALAADLRLTNVSDNPGWYTDEATHIIIAENLVFGRQQYQLITDSTLLFGRLPLFHVGLVGAYSLSDPATSSMTVLRTYTAVLGVVSVALLYALTRRTGGAMLALIAAGTLALYPQAVIYSRLGFSYNLLAPLVLLVFIGLDEYSETRNRALLALATVAAGLALVTEVMALVYALAVILVVLMRRRPLDLLWVLPLMALPFAVYAGLMLTSAPDAFLFDLNYTLGRLGGELAPAQQWQTLRQNYDVLLRQDLWLLLGLIGLFMLKPPRLRWLAVFLLLLPLVSVGRVVALFNLSAYYMIPMLPLIALGVGSLLRYGIPRIYGVVRIALTPRRAEALEQPPPVEPVLFSDDTQPIQPHTAGRSGLLDALTFIITLPVLALLIGVPVFDTIADLPVDARTGFVTDIDPFLVEPEDARAVAAFVNDNVEPTDTMVASPVVGWLFNTQVMDFQMSIAAAERVETPHLPADIPPARFAFDPTPRSARYIVIDDLWRTWGVAHIPGLDALMSEVQTSWTQVHARGQFVVYENPNRAIPDPNTQSPQ